MTTVTHIAQPEDSRCAWWSAIIPGDINATHLEVKAPLVFLKRGSDLELIPGTMLIDSEAKHHRKDRGYRIVLGYVMENDIIWMAPTKERKQHIKNNGAQHLMKGSGDVTGVIRMALFIRESADPVLAFKNLKSAV